MDYQLLLLYYNNTDIKKNRLDLRDEIRRLVSDSDGQCIRGIILEYFGFETNRRGSALHSCCSFCERSCNCNDCLK